MNESQISVRYAKALFKSALDKNLLDSVYKDMELLSEICHMEDFQFMLMLPYMQAERKCKIVNAILEKHLTGLSLSLINLVIKNRRESYLTGIARNYGDLYRKARGIRAARLITARAVEEPVTENIKKLIKNTLNAEAELTAQVDEEIIGGFKLTIEDLQYDASVSSILRKMRNQLLQNR